MSNTIYPWWQFTWPQVTMSFVQKTVLVHFYLVSWIWIWMKGSRTPIYNHPLNKDTLLLRTFLFVPRLYVFSKFNPLNTDTQLIKTDTFCGPLRVRINVFWTVSRGVAWLWKPANMKVENNGAVVYVGSSLTVQNPLFLVHKLWLNKLMRCFYWSVSSKW